MKMSLGGIWVCVVSVLARRWLADWKECKGSDGDDNDEEEESIGDVGGPYQVGMGLETCPSGYQ